MKVLLYIVTCLRLMLKTQRLFLFVLPVVQNSNLSHILEPYNLNELQDTYLVYILNELAGNSCIIFCATCANTQRVSYMLRNLGLTAIPLNGQMAQVSLFFTLQCGLLTVLS